MTTLFAKSNALTQLNKAINNTVNGGVELFYWDKKEALSLLQNKGLQLSKTLPQDGFVRSIRDNGSKVKTKFKNITESQQFKRWFGNWQINPKKSSKVVNNDGTPKGHASTKSIYSSLLLTRQHIILFLSRYR